MEGFEGTWINTVAALVRRHGADGASPLTAAEVEAIPGAERYVVGLYFSAVTIATLGYGGSLCTCKGGGSLCMQGWWERTMCDATVAECTAAPSPPIPPPGAASCCCR